jgi:shikimate kinase
MDKVKRIALTGFMGVGKTSVARHLAQMLRCERLDLDSLIEEREQRNIADIINADGEATYRKIETENLRRALQMKRVRILSLGGGTWTVAENIAGTTSAFRARSVRWRETSPRRTACSRHGRNFTASRIGIL